MKITDVIHKLSTARMEHQATTGSVLNTFVVPFFIDRFDLRKISHSIALAGSRGSGKSTYIHYFSHYTRFDKSLKSVSDDEFDCILLYWKPDTAYCQGLKAEWLGEDAAHLFTLHASLSLLEELANLLDNVSAHYPDLISELENKGAFWSSVSNVTKSNLRSICGLKKWIVDYKYEVSTRLNPINTAGLLSIEPKHMLNYLTNSLRHDYDKFAATIFKVFIDEFELLSINQQELINTYRKESSGQLSWNVAYKLNSKPTNTTTSDQWLQSPDDYIEENLDKYIEDSYKIFAAEVFLLTLYNAGLKCRYTKLTPSYLGDRANIEDRKKKEYQEKIFSLIQSFLPTPKIKELSEICLSKKSVKTKLEAALQFCSFSDDTIYEISKDPSLAVTVLGTYKQRSFDPLLIEKYALDTANSKEKTKVKDKISTFEFNTLLSLNLQNAAVQIPVYSGFDRFITMTIPNIRHFKELCLSALRHSNDLESNLSYEYIEDINPISSLGMHLGVISASTSLVKEVASYPPHGNKLSRMVNRIGELFRISQKSSIQTEPERVIFTFNYDHAGADADLEDFLSSALCWRVLVEDDSRRIKDEMQLTSKEFQINPIYAPKFGISYRKKRGVTFTLDEFKTIVTGSPEDFDKIKKIYQRKWRSDDRNESVQGVLI